MYAVYNRAFKHVKNAWKMCYFAAIYTFLCVLGGFCMCFHAFFGAIMWLAVFNDIIISSHYVVPIRQVPQ